MSDIFNHSKKFYEATPLDTWKSVLGDSMNYCFGNSISNNPEVFENRKTILDIGCGWGASANRMKSISKDATITCVSNVQTQLDYIGNKYKTIYADANEYIPTKKYELVTFFQSLTHMRDSALKNVFDSTDRIFINDFVFPISGAPVWATTWVMKIRSISCWEKLFKESGFEIKKFNILPLEHYMPDAQLWLDNIYKYEVQNTTWQMLSLEKLCTTLLEKQANMDNKEHLPPYKPDVFLVDIYAERV